MPGGVTSSANQETGDSCTCPSGSSRRKRRRKKRATCECVPDDNNLGGTSPTAAPETRLDFPATDPNEGEQNEGICNSFKIYISICNIVQK